MNIEDTEDWIDETDDSPETLEAEGDGQLFEHWRMEVDAGQKNIPLIPRFKNGCGRLILGPCSE